MAYTYSKKGVKVVQASRYTQAKKGYLVFTGNYPKTKSKYFKTKKSAVSYARKRK